MSGAPEGRDETFVDVFVEFGLHVTSLNGKRFKGSHRSIRLEMHSHEMGRAAIPSFLGTAPAAIATRVGPRRRGAVARARFQM